MSASPSRPRPTSRPAASPKIGSRIRRRRTRPRRARRRAGHRLLAILLFGLLPSVEASTSRAAADEAESPTTAQAAEEPAAQIEAIEDTNAPVVVRIHWDGVEAFEEESLEARIVTAARSAFELRFWREPPRLDPFVVEEDAERITQAYAEIGHFAAQVESEVARVDDLEGPPRRVRVRFRVEEGPVTRLAAWTLAWRPPPNAVAPPTAEEQAEARAIIGDRPGDVFGTRRYREVRRALLDWAAEAGFPYATIEGGAQVDASRHVASVDWTMVTGPRVSIGAITLSGLDRVEEHVVRRELAFREGDRFKRSAVDRSERRLIATGLFRSVVVGRPRRGDDPSARREEASRTLDVELRLEEAPPRSLRASVGYGAEDGPRGEASLDWRNFLGDGRRLRLRGFASLLDVGFESSLGQPYLLGRPGWRGDLTASALRQDRPGYEAFVTGAAGLVTWRPERDHPVSLSFGPGYELSEILEFNTTGGPSIRGPEDSTIVNTFTTLRYEDVDAVLDPKRGVRATLANEFGHAAFGSDLDYHFWQLDLRGYTNFGPFVLATRAAATILDPIDGDRSDVPLTRRLYSGGTNSVRGFGFQKLGPEDASNDPVGGLSRLEVGTELRWRVWSPFSLVAFVDAGDVRSRPWIFRPGELRAAAGPGLRVDTPVGPLRIDAGFLLNPPPDTDVWRLHLSVGHAF